MRIQPALRLSLTLGLFVFVSACVAREEELISQASKIQKHMRIGEVVELLGSPEYAAITESSKIYEGWDRAWTPHYDEMSKNHDRVLYYSYSKGVVHINVCFDLREQRVVYVSMFFGTG